MSEATDHSTMDSKSAEQIEPQLHQLPREKKIETQDGGPLYLVQCDSTYHLVYNVLYHSRCIQLFAEGHSLIYLARPY